MCVVTLQPPHTLEQPIDRRAMHWDCEALSCDLCGYSLLYLLDNLTPGCLVLWLSARLGLFDAFSLVHASVLVYTRAIKREERVPLKRKSSLSRHLPDSSKGRETQQVLARFLKQYGMS